MKRTVCALLILCFFMVSCSAGNNESSLATETSQVSDAVSQVSDAVSQVSDAVSQVSYAVSQVSDTVSQMSDTVSQVSDTVKISEDKLYDMVLGSWVGQMAGVVYGADMEYHYAGKMIPAEMIPDFSALNVNTALYQDDLYVEITFLNEMEKSGFDCSLDKLGKAFTDTQYALDHANKQGRENLRNGIKAGLSGSYLYNAHCDDIDWQIDADFVGTIYAGLTQQAAERSFEIGHLMNYGDGVYGGVFVAAMHAKAFTAKNLSEVIKAGFDAIPDNTKFKDIITDVKRFYDDGKEWEECWRYLEETWAPTDRCPGGCNIAFNIDAKLNAAYVLMGLLWGEGDFDKSMVIAQRCGQDSDCNPSTVGGVLGNFYGYDKIPAVFKKGLQIDGEDFTYANKNLKEVVTASIKLTKEIYASLGIESSENGVWELPEAEEVTPVKFEQWEDVPALTLTASVKDSSVSLNIAVVTGVGIESYKCDMGDGSEFLFPVAAYSYSATGKYIIKCTVTDKKGASASAETEVKITSAGTSDRGKIGTVRNIANFCAVTVSDTLPTGGGSKDVNVIRDGNKSIGALLQYDTYIGYCGRHTDYIGYLFDGEFDVSKVVYTEGIHYDNGGWFAEQSMALEILVNGKWQKAEYTYSPEYPQGSSQGDFGASAEAYTFKLKNAKCNGIRIIGIAGGSAGFINCTELEVYACES